MDMQVYKPLKAYYINLKILEKTKNNFIRLKVSINNKIRILIIRKK